MNDDNVKCNYPICIGCGTIIYRDDGKCMKCIIDEVGKFIDKQKKENEFLLLPNYYIERICDADKDKKKLRFLKNLIFHQIIEEKEKNET